MDDRRRDKGNLQGMEDQEVMNPTAKAGGFRAGFSVMRDAEED